MEREGRGDREREKERRLHVLSKAARKKSLPDIFFLKKMQPKSIINFSVLFF